MCAIIGKMCTHTHTCIYIDYYGAQAQDNCVHACPCNYFLSLATHTHTAADRDASTHAGIVPPHRIATHQSIHTGFMVVYVCVHMIWARTHSAYNIYNQLFRPGRALGARVRVHKPKRIITAACERSPLGATPQNARAHASAVKLLVFYMKHIYNMRGIKHKAYARVVLARTSSKVSELEFRAFFLRAARTRHSVAAQRLMNNTITGVYCFWRGARASM